MVTLRYIFIPYVTKISNELGLLDLVKFGGKEMGFACKDEVHVVLHKQGVGSHEAYCSCLVKCWHRRNLSNRGFLVGRCAVDRQ